mgnify:CR=1 FL=1
MWNDAKVSSGNPFGPGPSSGGPASNDGRARSPFGPPGGGPVGPPPGPFGPGPFTPAGGQSPFGPGSPGSGFPGSGTSPAPGPVGAPTTDLTPVGPPAALLAVAGTLAAAGTVVGVLFWDHWQALIGWLLAGPVAIGVVALFSSRDTLRRTSAVYLRPGWIMAAYAAVMVLVAAGVIVGACGFAIWVGRR